MTTISLRRAASSFDVSRVLRFVGARLRRALELSATPYMHGAYPSM